MNISEHFVNHAVVFEAVKAAFVAQHLIKLPEYVKFDFSKLSAKMKFRKVTQSLLCFV